MASISLLSIILTVAYATLTWTAFRVYSHRRWMNQLRKAGVPMPAWSWISGHLLYFYKHNRDLPPLASVNLALFEMASSFKEEEMFLLDIWPLSEPMLVVFNPEAATEVCQKLNLPKGRKNETMIRPITRGPTLLSMNGLEWKSWRTLFNPCFSTGIIAEQVPNIADHVSDFYKRLNEQANRGIINANLGLDYDQHVFVRAMGNIVEWHSFWDPFAMMNPLRPFVNWYNGRIVDSWIQSELHQRYETLKQDPQCSKSTIRKSGKSVMDLAIEAYITGNEGASLKRLDNHFLRTATHQMRLCLFAGNDTTSSTIVFAYHLLAKYPNILSQLRDEHDSLFSPDAAETAQQLKKDPSLLNKCQLTLAVIKETLRLYAPAATMRTGNSHCILKTQGGVAVPTGGLAIVIQHHATHRNRRVWPRPEEFLPERWLVGPEHELFPKVGAWRPFELGPRYCAGQTLTMAEIKVVLVMTVRFFDIKHAYEEFDKMQMENGGWLARLSSNLGLGRKQPGIYCGDRAYQTEKAGAHPSEAYPCYVSTRKK